jgi:hypothetical protein
MKLVTALDHPLDSGSLSSATRKTVEDSDAVVVLLAAAATNALFDAGVGYALGKPIILGLLDEAIPLPFDVSEFPVVRLVSADFSPLVDLLDRLSMVDLTPPQPPPPSSRSAGVLSKQRARTLADQVATALAASTPKEQHELLVQAVSGALSSAKLQMVASPRDGGSFDIGVWEPRLASIVGTPVLIEVKTTLMSQPGAAFEIVTKNTAKSGGQWALLVYGEGPPEALVDEWAFAYPVLPIKATNLIANLANRSFAEIVRDLRNRRVHGSRPLS